MATLEAHLAYRDWRQRWRQLMLRAAAGARLRGLTVAEIMALAAVCFLGATNVFRAWSQSITADEAYARNVFLSGPVTQIFSEYHVNNHVLQSVLSVYAIRFFGLSEFTLRLPSVLGGLLYLAVAWRLSRHWFGRGWLMAVSVLALTLNPFVLDYLSAARGYGLGLALLFYGFYHLARYFSADNAPPGHLYRAGIGLGLSVASTLVFLYPALALGGVAASILLLDGFFAGREALSRRFWLAVDQFAGPALVSAFILLAIPLTRVQPAYFYYGARDLYDFAASIVAASLFHSLNVWRLGAWLPGFPQWPRIITAAVIPAMLVVAVAVSAAIVRRWVRSRRFEDMERNGRFLLLATGTVVAMFVMLLVTGYGFRVPFPQGRTGIYWALFVTLVCLGLTDFFLRRGAWQRWAAVPCLAFVLCSIGLFAAGFTTDYYSEWLYDRGTKRIVNLVRERRRLEPKPEVRLGVSPLLEPSINFYRWRYRLDWLKPVDRKGPDGAFDYYVLLPADHAVMKKRKLIPVFRDELSGELLAVPGGAGK